MASLESLELLERLPTPRGTIQASLPIGVLSPILTTPIVVMSCYTVKSVDETIRPGRRLTTSSPVPTPHPESNQRPRATMAPPAGREVEKASMSAESSTNGVTDGNSRHHNILFLPCQRDPAKIRHLEEEVLFGFLQTSVKDKSNTIRRLVD